MSQVLTQTAANSTGLMLSLSWSPCLSPTANRQTLISKINYRLETHITDTFFNVIAATFESLKPMMEMSPTCHRDL
jgi:hypothetical protein